MWYPLLTDWLAGWLADWLTDWLVGIGKENEPVALKRTLGWVLFGENKNNKRLNVDVFSEECNLD